MNSIQSQPNPIATFTIEDANTLIDQQKTLIPIEMLKAIISADQTRPNGFKTLAENYTQTTSRIGIVARSCPAFEPGKAGAETAQL